MAESKPPTDAPAQRLPRRTVLSRGTGLAMAGGLVAGYGGFAAVAARYLYPARPEETGWLFVIEIARVKPGDALIFRTPGGARATIARRGDSGEVTDFIALSSTCPHLGCQVHWQAQENRFFCPCHNGVFEPSGKGIGGPPGDAKQSLPRYALKIDGGLLYIEVPVDQVALGPGTIEPQPRALAATSRQRIVPGQTRRLDEDVEDDGRC